MESAFRKRVEASIAQALSKRIQKADDLEVVEPDLKRLRNLIQVNNALKRHLRNALLYLKDAKFVSAETAITFEEEWKKLGGNAYSSQKLIVSSRKSLAERSNGARVYNTDTPFTKLLRSPSDIYGKELQVPWNNVDGEELEGFLDQIDPIDGMHVVDPATTQVAWSQLPFYEKVALIRVVDQTWSKPNLIVYYLTDQGNLFRLNGTSPPIHEVNAKAPIYITEDNVLDYLKFFSFFVRGEEGPFYIAENLNDPYMPVMPDELVKSIFEGTLTPATFEGMNDQGHYLCDGVVFYSNALFIANFAVQPTGMLEMLDDEPIAADLPIKINAPIS